MVSVVRHFISTCRIILPIFHCLVPPRGRFLPRGFVSRMSSSRSFVPAPAADGAIDWHKKVIILAGATSAGKSAVSMELARLIDAEIVIADSVQVYRGLDIVSNKPTPEDTAKVPHHLIDVLEPSENFTAGEFCRMAVEKIDDISRRGKTPIIVGGATMWIKWLVEGIPDAPASTERVAQLAQALLSDAEASKDWDSAMTILRRYSTRLADKLFPNDWYRMRRYLEVAIELHERVQQNEDGGTASSAFDDATVTTTLQNKRRPLLEGYDVRCFFLSEVRETLCHRIDNRCEMMLANGMINEVGDLLLSGALTPVANVWKAIGYREAINYLLGGGKAPTKHDRDATFDFHDFLSTFAANTRSYARKQVKFHRRDDNVLYVSIDRSRDVNLEPPKKVMKNTPKTAKKSKNSVPVHHASFKEMDEHELFKAIDKVRTLDEFDQFYGRLPPASFQDHTLLSETESGKTLDPATTSSASANSKTSKQHPKDTRVHPLDIPHVLVARELLHWTQQPVSVYERMIRRQLSVSPYVTTFRKSSKAIVPTISLDDLVFKLFWNLPVSEPTPEEVTPGLISSLIKDALVLPVEKQAEFAAIYALASAGEISFTSTHCQSKEEMHSLWGILLGFFERYTLESDLAVINPHADVPTLKVASNDEKSPRRWNTLFVEKCSAELVKALLGDERIVSSSALYAQNEELMTARVHAKRYRHLYSALDPRIRAEENDYRMKQFVSHLPPPAASHISSIESSKYWQYIETAESYRRRLLAALPHLWAAFFAPERLSHAESPETKVALPRTQRDSSVDHEGEDIDDFVPSPADKRARLG